MLTMTCACGKTYRFAPEYAGRSARCRACGKVFRIGEGAGESKPKHSAKKKDADDWASGLEDLERSGKAEVRVTASEDDSDEGVPAARPPRGSYLKPRTGATGFLKDVGFSFLFVADPHNAIIFATLWLLSILRYPVAIVPCFGLVAILLITGVICAYKFHIIATAANGDDRLPPVDVVSGIGEMAEGAAKLIASWIVVMLPALAWVLISGVGVGELLNSLSGRGSLIGALSSDDFTVVLLIYGGMFLWPMVILCVALGGIDSLLRIDLILLTLVRTFPAYLLATGILIGTSLLQEGLFKLLGLAAASSAAAGGTGGTVSFNSQTLGKLIMLGAVAGGVEVYLTLVCLRVIGLYYHHFKSRFAWSWG